MKFSRKFVCEDLEYSTYGKNIPAPIFRKSFCIESIPQTAEITICGLGFYDLFVNGKKITKGYLAPYISNPDHITYYDNYNIKEHLNVGENVIGVMLGDGFLVGKTSVWDFRDNVFNSAPMLALTAEIDLGEEKIEFEADSFKCKKGPIQFCDFHSGVFYDARLFEKGWFEPNFIEKDWHDAINAVNRPRGKAKLCEAEPVKVYREIKPVSIKKGELAEYICSGQITEFCKQVTPFEKCVPMTGGYIYDFGENNSGIFRLKIKGERGQKIDIQCGEQLIDGGKLTYRNIGFYPDGFSQRDIYYLSGDGEEIFEPMFTYHGYRYIYVYGITEEQATEDLFTYLVMSSDLEERGTFECSDDRVNLIYQAGRRSDISNFYYFPADCPHREKNGWTADAAVSAEHMIMTIGAENSWREWLNNIRLAQKEDGMLPGIIPTDSWGYEWGNGPAWDIVIFNLPWFAYKYRGETAMIKENASAMLRYLEFTAAKKRDERGIVEWGLGDWVPVDRPGNAYQSALGFTDSVMVLDMCRKATVMFDAVGLPMHKAFAESLGKEILAAIRAEYVDPETLVVKHRCQTSQALALFFDVLTEEEKPKAFEVLMDIIKEDNYSITSGVLGLRCVFHVLSDFGQSELAYKMITKKEYPSYGYWIDHGETTLFEHFVDYWDDGYYRESKNHHFLGDVVNWFMRIPGGLNVKSHNEVVIKPHFIDSLTWCKTTHKLPAGEIEIYWKRTEDGIELKVNSDEGVNTKLELNPEYVISSCDDRVYTLKKL